MIAAGTVLTDFHLTEGGVPPKIWALARTVGKADKMNNKGKNLFIKV